MYRIAYLVSHPIQYQAPLFRELSADPDIELKVFFCSSQGSGVYYDPEFGKVVSWSVPLLDGYDYEFLPSVGSNSTLSWLHPFNYGLYSRLKKGNFDVLWIHGYARAYNWIALLAAKFLGIPVILRDDTTLLARPQSWSKNQIKRLMFLVLRNLVRTFLPVGTRNKEYFKYFGVNDSQLLTVPYAVDNQYFQQADNSGLAKELGLEESRPIILFAGKFTAGKRPQDLLQAHKLLPEPRPYLILVGDGEKREALKAMAGEAVYFVGFKNQQELLRYYALCDVFVLTSEFETWGLVVNEVMNAGKAIVLSENVGCTPDLLKDNGMHYPTGDVGALAMCLKEICSNDEVRAEMGRQSLAVIQQNSFETNVAQIKELLKEF